MKTCTYCGSLVHEEKDHLFYCDFCLMYIQNPQEDGKREHIEYRKQASEKDLSNTTPELMNLPTIELLFLLKISRKKRTEKYDELCRSRRYTKGDSESKNVQKAIEGYQFFTKKMYIIENILIQRIGYIPERVNQLFLEGYLLKINNSKKNKPHMKIF